MFYMYLCFDLYIYIYIIKKLTFLSTIKKYTLKFFTYPSLVKNTEFFLSILIK